MSILCLLLIRELPINSAPDAFLYFMYLEYRNQNSFQALLI